jgi:hypothetical protein
MWHCLRLFKRRNVYEGNRDEKTFTSVSFRPQADKKRSREEELILHSSSRSSSSRCFTLASSSPHREIFIFLRTRVINSIPFQDS